MRRRTAAVLATAALAVPLAADQDASDGAIGPVTPGAAVRAAQSSPPRPSTSTSARPPHVGRPPVRVSIAGTGIAASVVPVGVTAAGDVAVPDHVDRVG